MRVRRRGRTGSEGQKEREEGWDEEGGRNTVSTVCVRTGFFERRNLH